MGDWKIWRREGGMTMLHGKHREVRYAIPADIYVYRLSEGSQPFLAYQYGSGYQYEPLTEVPIRCVRAVGATEDLPEDQWIPSGEFPAKSLVRLYVPEGET